MSFQSTLVSGLRCPALWLSFTVLVAGCEGEPQPPAVRSQTLVISRWSHDLAIDHEAFGLDLDGRESRGDEGECLEARDFTHPIDARAGIDNQYAVVLLDVLEDFYGEPMTERVQAELEAGHSLYGLEITAPADPRGSVEVALVSYEATGALPRAVALQAADGSLIATVLSRSVAVRSGDALIVTLGNVEIPMGEGVGPRMIEDAQIRLVLEADGTIVRGDFGGIVAMTTVVAVANLIGSPPVEERWVREIAMPDAHLNPSTHQCDGLSIGLGLSFSAVEPPS